MIWQLLRMIFLFKKPFSIMDMDIKAENSGPCADGCKAELLQYNKPERFPAL